MIVFDCGLPVSSCCGSCWSNCISWSAIQNSAWHGLQTGVHRFWIWYHAGHYALYKELCWQCHDVSM